MESGIVKYEQVTDKPIWEFVFPGYKEIATHDRQFNWWFPNTSGLMALFESAGFVEVRLLHELEPRASIVCYK